MDEQPTIISLKAIRCDCKSLPGLIIERMRGRGFFLGDFVYEVELEAKDVDSCGVLQIFDGAKVRRGNQVLGREKEDVWIDSKIVGNKIIFGYTNVQGRYLPTVKERIVD